MLYVLLKMPYNSMTKFEEYLVKTWAIDPEYIEERWIDTIVEYVNLDRETIEEFPLLSLATAQGKLMSTKPYLFNLKN